ncbi:MAG: hypothetical protein ACJ72Q_14765 [Nitrososphaeraceae archaeon]
MSNKTTVTPAGKTTTTIINQTSSLINVTPTNATTADLLFIAPISVPDLIDLNPHI